MRITAPNETSTTQPAISGSAALYVGGLVGWNHGSIANSYSLPTASGSQALIVGGSGSDVGGLVGYDSNPGDVLTLQISNSYATGSVGGGSYNGGVIGFDGSNNQQTQIFQNVYWDTSTSNITNTSQGAGNVSNDPGLSGVTSSGLISQVGSGLSSPPWYSISVVQGGLPCLQGVTSGCTPPQ